MKKNIIIVMAIVLASLPFATFAKDKVIDCNNATTTLEINQCASTGLNYEQIKLKKYLKASYEHNSYNPELVKAIKVAQKDWQVYISSHCDSVYINWKDGTMHGVMTLTCQSRLTKRRTHEIWENFLTYMDSTPPVLPEPSVE